MAGRKHHHKKKENRVVSTVLYIVTIVLLLAGLGFFYFHNRAQKASFEEMKKQATSKETVGVLEPKAELTTRDTLLD